MTNRAFRDYATRVSFNMSLTRNQILVFADVLYKIEHPGYQIGKTPYNEARNAAREAGDHLQDAYIVGYRKLKEIGLVEDHPLWKAEERRIDALKEAGKSIFPHQLYSLPRYQLTKVGECMAVMLREAGLIAQAPANSNTRRKKKKKAV